jgi:hypothetical protein
MTVRHRRSIKRRTFAPRLPSSFVNSNPFNGSVIIHACYGKKMLQLCVYTPEQHLWLAGRLEKDVRGTRGSSLERPSWPSVPFDSGEKMQVTWTSILPIWAHTVARMFFISCATWRWQLAGWEMSALDSSRILAILLEFFLRGLFFSSTLNNSVDNWAISGYLGHGQFMAKV